MLCWASSTVPMWGIAVCCRIVPFWDQRSKSLDYMALEVSFLWPRSVTCQMPVSGQVDGMGSFPEVHSAGASAPSETLMGWALPQACGGDSFCCSIKGFKCNTNVFSNLTGKPSNCLWWQILVFSLADKPRWNISWDVFWPFLFFLLFMCFFEPFLPVVRLTRKHPCHTCYSSNVLRTAGGGALHFARLFLTPKYLWRGQSRMVAGFFARRAALHCQGERFPLFLLRVPL